MPSRSRAMCGHPQKTSPNLDVQTMANGWFLVAMHSSLKGREYLFPTGTGLTYVFCDTICDGSKLILH